MANPTENVVKALRASAEDDDSYSSSTGAAFAWHTLRLFQGDHPFDPGLHNLYEVGHSAQCETLPPGASCWFAHDPHRHWWPAGDQYGTYRVRTTWWLIGTGRDGDDPEPVEGFDTQVLDETTGTWSDWTGTTAGEAAANRAAGEAMGAGQPDDDTDVVARVQTFVDVFTAAGWNHIAATTPWERDPDRKTLKVSEMRELIALAKLGARATPAAKALAPAEFSIRGDIDDDGRAYAYVRHDPCGAWPFGGPADPYELDAAELLTRIADHRCAQRLGALVVVPTGD